MSTILKALRRLEEEKARGTSSRPLREEIASGPGELQRGRGVPWLPVLAMLLGLGLGASAWWVWPYERGGEPVREAAAQTPAPAVAAPAPPAAHSVAIAPVVIAPAAPAPQDFVVEAAPEPDPELLAGGEMLEGGPPEDAFASAVAVVERPRPEPRIEAAPAVPAPTPQRVIADPPRVAAEPPAITAKRTPAGTDAPPAKKAPPKPVAATKPAPVEPTPPIAGAREAIEPPPERTSPAPERVATASTPPAAARSADTETDAAVQVKRTQWHPDPSRRSAELVLAGANERVKEGDVVGDFVVTEIRPSGVVLTRDGKTIERGIGQAP